MMVSSWKLRPQGEKQKCQKDRDGEAEFRVCCPCAAVTAQAGMRGRRAGMRCPGKMDV